MLCHMQELLDVTRGLLEEWESAAGGAAGSGELKLDADQDETREKFRIVKVPLAWGQLQQNRCRLV